VEPTKRCPNTIIIVIIIVIVIIIIIITINTIYNTISFIEDDKNKGKEVSADTAATETYYMMGINKIYKVN